MLKQITGVSLTDSEVKRVLEIGKGNFNRGVVFALGQAKGCKIPTIDDNRKHSYRVNLDSNDRDNAATIGNGSMSAGIRFAINNYSDLPPPIGNADLPKVPAPRPQVLLTDGVVKFKVPPPPKD